MGLSFLFTTYSYYLGLTDFKHSPVFSCYLQVIASFLLRGSFLYYFSIYLIGVIYPVLPVIT